MMRFFFILIMVLGFSSGHTAEKPTIDDFLKKMEKPDPNFVSALKDFQKTFEEFLSNKEDEKEVPLLIQAMESTLCLQAFQQGVDPKLMAEIMKSFTEKGSEERMKNIMSNPEKLKSQILKIARFQSRPREACHFKLNENTDTLKKEKVEISKDQEALDKIFALKKTVHPTFVKLISDIEKKKKYLSLGVSNRDEIILEPNHYERNFVKVYDYQCKFVDEFSMKKIALLPNACINSVRTLFNVSCKGKPRYSLVKGQFTQMLLCSDDNSAKIDRTCNYQVTFIR